MRKNFSSLLSTRYEPMNMISMINKPFKWNKKRRSPSLNLYIIDLYDLLKLFIYWEGEHHIYSKKYKRNWWIINYFQLLWCLVLMFTQECKKNI